MAAPTAIDLTNSGHFTEFSGSSTEDISYAKTFWQSVQLQPPMESRLVSSDIKQRLRVAPSGIHSTYVARYGISHLLTTSRYQGSRVHSWLWVVSSYTHGHGCTEDHCRCENVYPHALGAWCMYMYHCIPFTCMYNNMFYGATIGASAAEITRLASWSTMCRVTEHIWSWFSIIVNW